MGLKRGTERNGYGVKMRNGTDMVLKRNLKFQKTCLNLSKHKNLSKLWDSHPSGGREI